MDKQITKEKVRVKTEEILERVNHLARESHKRHITIKDRHHRPFLVFPMSLGIIATAALPVIAILGLAAFLINDWQVELKKHDHPSD